MTYIKRDLEPKILSLSKEYSAILITGQKSGSAPHAIFITT